MGRMVESGRYGVRRAVRALPRAVPGPARYVPEKAGWLRVLRMLHVRAGCLRLLGAGRLAGTWSCLRSLLRAYEPGGMPRLGARPSVVLREEEGQGTTEYAILVGILVVIAIAAIALFRGRIQELWNSIAGAINGL